MFVIKNIATHNIQNGNTWSVRLQVNFKRYVCKSMCPLPESARHED